MLLFLGMFIIITMYPQKGGSDKIKYTSETIRFCATCENALFCCEIFPLVLVAGKTDNGVDGVILCPFGYNGTEFNFITNGVMNLVNKDGKGRQFTDKVTKLISLSILLVITFFKKTNLTVFLLNTVKDDLFSVCNSDQTEKLGKRLMISNLLNVRVLGFV